MNKEIARYDTYVTMSKGSNSEGAIIILGRDLDPNIPTALQVFKANISKAAILRWESYELLDKDTNTIEIKNVSNGKKEELELIPIHDVFSNQNYAGIYKSLRQLSSSIIEADDAIFATYNHLLSTYSRHYPDASLQIDGESIEILSPTQLAVNDVSNSPTHTTKKSTKRKAPKGAKRNFNIWI